MASEGLWLASTEELDLLGAFSVHTHSPGPRRDSTHIFFSHDVESASALSHRDPGSC